MILDLNHSKYICKQALQSFKDSNNGKYPYFELFIFFGLPIALAFTIIFGSKSLEDMPGAVITALSIFIGFLINMLIPFFTVIDSLEKDSILSKTADDSKSADRTSAVELKKLRLIQYKILYAQVSFSILLSLGGLANAAILKYGNIIFDIQKKIPWTEIILGKAVFNIIQFLTAYLLILNFFNVIKIVVSSNALIYPMLNSASKVKNSFH